MQPLDLPVHYGITDRDFLDVHDVQMDLLPDQLHQLRWKLNQKAKNLDFFAYEEMLTGEPDAGNLHVRFDEGEWQEGLANQAPPATLYSTGKKKTRTSRCWTTSLTRRARPRRSAKGMKRDNEPNSFSV